MQLYGLIGYPLTHSFSQGYFRRKFEAENITYADYLNFPIRSIELFRKVIYDHPNLMGLNVTIPYKEQVLRYLDEADRTAWEIGAVNTIKIERNGDIQLIGYNTDVIGFRESISPLLKPEHTKALVLGTGGSSKAVVHALKQLGIDYEYVSRNSTFHLNYEALNQEIMETHPIIINTTPLGMYPELSACPDIPYQYLTEKHLLFDLVYNPEKTLFLQKGEEKGATIKNGLEMLKIQAEKSWEIWKE